VADWWDSGGYSYGDVDSFGIGSPSFGDFTPSLDTSWLDTYTSPSGGGYSGGFGGGGYGGGGGGYGGGGWGSLMSNPQTLLGLGGGIAGLIGAISGGGVKGTQKPVMDNRQIAQFEAAQRAQSGLSPFAAGTTPAQQMQMQLLKAISKGKGLNQNYARAVESAFEPQMGNLYEQAAKAGRSRGFHDAPATSPPGGAIFGPGLADLQGQIAQAKLAMMMGLPGLYSQPINQQLGAAQGFASGQGNLFNMYPTGSQTKAPLGPQIGTAIGQGMIGLGSAFGQQQQQQQQNQFQNAMMEWMNKQRTPYEFGGYSGT
jgi:hypothetical protein